MPETSTATMRENFQKKFDNARRRTLEIFDLADESALHASPGFGFRPILWHLAHIGAFEEYWILQQANHETALNQRFQIIFDPIKTPRENSKELPSKAEMLNYLRQVRENANRVLDDFDFASENSLFKNGYVFDLVHQHELQHQETLAYLFHLLPLEDFKSQISNLKLQISDRKTKEKRQMTKSFPAQTIQIGASNQDFAYDNESPAFEKFVPAFKLDRFLTTNCEFAEFVREKGYERPEFWSAEGWQFCQKENLRQPLYWTRSAANDWTIRTLFAENSLDEIGDFPIYGVSYHEAEAYARFRGRRLPTEFECECAAQANTNSTPRDNAPIADLSGNLWQFTSSDFAPYPNFRAFPYEDYSEKWFDGDHKVLRGGSFATAPEISRTSFRNFFRKNFRIAFAGIRLAESV